MYQYLIPDSNNNSLSVFINKEENKKKTKIIKIKHMYK